MDIKDLHKEFLDSTGVSTDTRKIKADSIFFALKGPNFNGNTFAAKALEAGAKYAVIDEKEFALDNSFILVDDVLKTLQQLAAFHRNQFTIPFIAITGSNGKTTTKELMSAALSTRYKTFYTHGNLNNHIGVPLTLLSITKETEMAVIELGANHIGENAFLCEMVNPDYGIITNNGKDHLEGYGSLEGVRKGNGELYEFLKKKNKPAFVSAYQPDLINDSAALQRIIYGENKQASVKGNVTQQFPFLNVELLFNDGAKPVAKTHLIGKYNLENILAAAAVAYHFKVPANQIAEAVSNYMPANNRSQLVEKNGNSFILDAYNANPSSMSLTIESFAELPVKNKIVVLGEMLELGDYSLSEHEQILAQLSKYNFDEIVLVGEGFAKAVKNPSAKIHLFKNIEELKRWFAEQKFNGHAFLLKGSRLNKLEKLLEDN